ncbi:MAG: NUDIX hydrolase [Acidiferrobacterales bacterium]|nr:NUDIX hydrolase [Acidiferrobacterales bacterium]
MQKNKKMEYEGRVISVSVEDVELPNGSTLVFERVHHPGGSVIVAVDDQDRICLLKQYRHIANGWLWELPAGKLDPGESPDNTARRELLEEAGVEASEWTDLGKAYSSPGIFDEVLHFYLARGLRERTPSFDAHENIEIHWLPLETVLALLSEGDIVDGKTMIGICRLRDRLQQNN